jgi:DNA-binding protein YbaB
MNKEEFIEKMKALVEQKKKLQQEYVESNAKYAAGTKVKVTRNGKERIGVVRFNVVESNEVVPYVTMITQSGEDSVRRIVVLPGDKVEVIE